MSRDVKELATDLGKGVGWIAAALAVVGGFASSGLTADSVNGALAAAEGGAASAQDYLAVFQVALAAYPIIFGVIGTLGLFEYEPLSGWPAVFALAVVWGLAASLTGTVFDQTEVPTPVGAGPWGVVLGLVEATFKPYTLIVAVQGLIVGAGTYAVFAWMRDKHALTTST